jgi:hypothetical protein
VKVEMPTQQEDFMQLQAAQGAGLLRASAGADLRTPPFPRDDQFYYTRSVTLSVQNLDRLILNLAGADGPSTLTRADLQGTARGFVLTEHRGWASATRTGRVLHTELDITLLAPHPQDLWHANGRPSLRPPSMPQAVAATGEHTYRVGNISLSREQLLEFPTDPQLICERLLATRPEDPPKVLTQLVDALRSGPKPVALRRGIHGALLLQPNVRAVGSVWDGAGREGLALRYIREDQDRHHEQELILDGRSFELIGRRCRALDGLARRFGVPTGAVIENTVVLERAVTDHIDADAV